MFCFFHDQFIEEDKAGVSVSDRGFTLGDGVFDTQIAIDGHLQDGHLHFERLLHDAVVIGIPLDKAIEELKTIASMLLVRNSISTGRWIIRTELTRGVGLRGLATPDITHPTLVMKVSPAARVSDMPINVIISQTTRRNEHSPLSRIKSLNYLDNILALMEAKDSGAEDAILLNTEGNVTCLTASNIFILENGHWITPPITDGVLPGITRLKLIAENNARQEHISVERLQKAEEIWQSNSVIGIRQIELI